LSEDKDALSKEVTRLESLGSSCRDVGEAADHVQAETQDGANQFSRQATPSREPARLLASAQLPSSSCMDSEELKQIADDSGGTTGTTCFADGPTTPGRVVLQDQQEDGDLHRCTASIACGLSAFTKGKGLKLRSSWDELSEETVMEFSPLCTISIAAVHTRAAVGMDNGADACMRTTLSLTRRMRRVAAHDHTSTFSLCWFRSVLHPNSDTRLLWVFLTFVALVYDMITTPMVAFNISEAMSVLDVVDLMFLAIWTLDMFLAFRTGYFTGSQVELRPGHIVKNYIRTWFFFDLLIVLVGWTSELAALGSKEATIFKAMRFFRFLRILRLLRLAKMKKILEHMEYRITSDGMQLVLSMVKLVAGFGILVHFTACIWYALGTSVENGWPSYDAAEGAKNTLFWYSASLRWTLAQINGRTDVDDRRNMRERMFTCFVAGGLAILVMAVFISSITTAMMELGTITEERKKKMRRLNAFLKKHQISMPLTVLIKHSLDAKAVEEVHEDDSMILSYLPKSIQGDLMYEVRAPLLLRHPLFASINAHSKKVMWQLCNEAMLPEIAFKDSVIFDLNDFSTRMLIVVTGAARYSMSEDEGVGCDFDTDPQELDDGLSGRNLSRGRQISEAALWIEWHNCGRLTAMATSHFIALNAIEFGEAVKQHLGAHARSIMYARAFIETMRDQEIMSDIMDLNVFFQPERSEHPFRRFSMKT